MELEIFNCVRCLKAKLFGVNNLSDETLEIIRLINNNKEAQTILEIAISERISICQNCREEVGDQVCEAIIANKKNEK